jgi:hypothetical protein
MKLQRLTTFTHSILSIGVALAVRDQLLEALSAAGETLIPGSLDFISSVVGSLDLWTRQPTAVAALSSASQLAMDMGMNQFGDSKDITMQRLLRSVLFDADVNEESMRLFELLPVALAATYISDRWDNVGYDAEKGVFDSNEQTIGLAAPKLIVSILGIDAGYPQSQAPLTRVKEAAELYIEISSHLLVVMRMQETEASYRTKPLRAMTSVLEASATNFPADVASRLIFEKHFPYALVHSDNMDIALGRMKTGDKIDISLFEIQQLQDRGLADKHQEFAV